MFGPLEPPNDYRIFNRRRPDGSFPPLSEFFDKAVAQANVTHEAEEYQCPCGCNDNVEHCVYAAVCPNCSKKFYGSGYASRDQLCPECRPTMREADCGHSAGDFTDSEGELRCNACGARRLR